jgi:hypothetical protein
LNFDLTDGFSFPPGDLPSSGRCSFYPNFPLTFPGTLSFGLSIISLEQTPPAAFYGQKAQDGEKQARLRPETGPQSRPIQTFAGMIGCPENHANGNQNLIVIPARRPF